MYTDVIMHAMTYQNYLEKKNENKTQIKIIFFDGTRMMVIWIKTEGTENK